MWRPGELLQIAMATLRTVAEADDAEHAVRSIDGLSEVDLHPLFTEAFMNAGFGVLREQGYPGEDDACPEDRDRERCDLVLLPESHNTLADPVTRRREQDKADGTLFHAVERQRPDDADAVAVTDAYWLEVKVVGQHVIVDGYAQPNRSYSSELVGAIAQDVRKLARDDSITFGALLILLFTESEEVARHDLTMALHRCLDRDVPLGSPEIESFPITDRIGNTTCLAALIPAR